MDFNDDKIYYNITINYDEKNLISEERHTSNASTEIELMDNLINQTTLYDLCVSKFKLDTFSIPLVIPELKQPQKIVDSKIDLNYWVKLLIPVDELYKTEERDDGQGNMVNTNVPNEGTYNYSLINTVYLSLKPKKFNKKFKVKAVSYDDTKSYHSMEDSFEITKPCRKITSSDKTMGFVDNLDPFCYIYDAQEFIDCINSALMELFRNDFEDNVHEGAEAFFKLDNSTLTYYQKRREQPYIIVFSGNLYRYFGAPFNTKQVPDENGWMIPIDPDSRGFINKDKNGQIIASYANPNFDGDIAHLSDIDKYYNIMTSDISITQTWNACKLILICSTALPIHGEYVPVSEDDGLLIHENSTTMKALYTDLHGTSDSASYIGVVSNKTPGTKVLESYYPLSTSGGDLRTQMIYTNDNIDVGTKLTLTGATRGIKRFDISVKWVDIFNNIHDLELLPNCSCDIRLAFVKKSVKQDVLNNGFKHILRALNYKYEPDQKRRRPNGVGGLIFNEDAFF